MFKHDAIYRVRRRFASWSAASVLAAVTAASISLQPNRQPNSLKVVLYLTTLVAMAFACGSYRQKCQLDKLHHRQYLRLQDEPVGRML